MTIHAPELYVKTGDKKYLVPGMGPFAVLRSGAVEMLPSSLPPDGAIEQFEADRSREQLH